MQLAGRENRRWKRPSGRRNFALGRAIRYVGHYPRLALIAIVALLIATAAQLAVPQLVQNIIDTVVNNVAGKAILDLPESIQKMAAERLALDLENVRLNLENAPRALLIAGFTVVIFAIARGLFSFTQTYMSQMLSENIAFELRNDLFAKIQRLKIGRVFSFLFPFIFLIVNLGQAAVLYFGGRQIIDGALTIGEWQKFSLYLVNVFIPMGQLGFIISLMAQASASAGRIFEILDAKNEVENKPGAIELGGVNGRIQFENVTFRYFAGSEPVLQNVSFMAEPGQTIALLGATGSGKTTIINLIPRFYDVSEGRVLIDGHDVRHATIESVRRHIGIVLQETTLFSGTIRENIAFGRPNASEAEIVAAAKAAAAHDFITAFPQGYDTPVGERGATLSGGQVLVLNDGQIIEQGTHDSLLAARGFYYDLYMSQFRRTVTNGSGPESIESQDIVPSPIS